MNNFTKKYCSAAALAASTLIALPTPAMAQDSPTLPAEKEEFGVPVFSYDITDRPYTILGEVKAGVRKATIFSKTPSQGKVYRELWERARKLGADAVIKASYGDPQITALSWGSVPATGLAIKFNPPVPLVK
jgi:hypothetical protein